MMKLISAVLAVILAGAVSTALSQSSDDKFEVVSIRRADPAGVGSGTMIRGTGWEARRLTLKRLVEFAYPEFADVGLVVGGPTWFRTSIFDIQAKAKQPVTESTAPAMVRHALAEHFDLQVRAETRSLDVYALVFARADRRLGPNLKPSARECIAARANRQPMPPQCRPSIDQFKQGFSTPTSTMSEFVKRLRWTVGGFLDGPILDRTGLEGVYDISIWYSPIDLTASQAPGDRTSLDAAILTDIQSLISALPGQLGLKLERKRDSAEVLVVQSASLPALD